MQFRVVALQSGWGQYQWEEAGQFFIGLGLAGLGRMCVILLVHAVGDGIPSRVILPPPATGPVREYRHVHPCRASGSDRLEGWFQ